jgi:hypothetical protein
VFTCLQEERRSEWGGGRSRAGRRCELTPFSVPAPRIVDDNCGRALAPPRSEQVHAVKLIVKAAPMRPDQKTGSDLRKHLAVCCKLGHIPQINTLKSNRFVEVR